MTAGAAAGPARGSSQARIAAFERYAELLAMQVESLLDDDLSRFEELAAESERTARDIDTSPGYSGAAAGEPAADEESAVMDALHRCQAQSDALHQQLRKLRQQTLSDAMDLEHARRAVRAYGPGTTPTGSLDVDL